MHEIDKRKLSDQTKFRLYEIKKIENDFINKINDRKSCSKKLSKNVTIFDYVDKSLIVLSATTGGVSFISFYKCYWSTSWNSKRKLYFNFFSNNWNN